MFRFVTKAVGRQWRVSNLQLIRGISVSQRLCLKEIHEKHEGDTTYFEGVYIKSPRQDLLLNTQNDHGACPLCAAGLLVKHTDVLIIKQFVDDFGKLLPRRLTGLCRWQQRRMQYVVEMAVRAGLVNSLIPTDELVPEYQKGWRCFNSYYDEELIPRSKTEYAIEKRREYELAYKLAKAERDAHEEMLKSRANRRLVQNK